MLWVVGWKYQHGQSMFEIGDASMCMLILDTNVAVTDIL
jgi:hypothetical protein